MHQTSAFLRNIIQYAPQQAGNDQTTIITCRDAMNSLASCFDTIPFGTKRLKQILHRQKGASVATLGPEGTSSEYAALAMASHIGRDARCMLFATYEEAAQAVIDRQAEYLVVANAYHNINHFYISDLLVVAGVFPRSTPPYGVAVARGSNLEKKRIVLASHPAPSHLIKRWFGPLQQPTLLHADSTSIAAKLVVAGTTDACITTDPARRKNDLAFITDTFRIRMIWSIFVRKDHPAAQCLFEERHE